MMIGYAKVANLDTGHRLPGRAGYFALLVFPKLAAERTWHWSSPWEVLTMQRSTPHPIRGSDVQNAVFPARLHPLSERRRWDEKEAGVTALSALLRWSQPSGDLSKEPCRHDNGGSRPPPPLRDRGHSLPTVSKRTGDQTATLRRPPHLVKCCFRRRADIWEASPQAPRESATETGGLTILYGRPVKERTAGQAVGRSSGTNAGGGGQRARFDSPHMLKAREPRNLDAGARVAFIKPQLRGTMACIYTSWTGLVCDLAFPLVHFTKRGGKKKKKDFPTLE